MKIAVFFKKAGKEFLLPRDNPRIAEKIGIDVVA